MHVIKGNTNRKVANKGLTTYRFYEGREPTIVVLSRREFITQTNKLRGLSVDLILVPKEFHSRSELHEKNFDYVKTGLSKGGRVAYY